MFFPVLPDIKVVFENVKTDWKNSAEIRLFYIVEKLFDSYMNTDDYNRNDVQIGHTYFIRKTDDDVARIQMKNRFLYQVIPVIREYYNDGILMPDVYGKEPSAYENECISIIKRMISVSDMEELEQIYSTLLDALFTEEIEEKIKNVLFEKNILAE